MEPKEKRKKKRKASIIIGVICLGTLLPLLIISSTLSTFKEDTLTHKYEAIIPANDYSYEITDMIHTKQGDRLDYALTIKEGYIDNISAFYVTEICYGFWRNPDYSYLSLYIYINWIKYNENFALYNKWDIGDIKERSHNQGNEVYFSARRLSVPEPSQYYFLFINDGNTTAKLSFEYKISNIIVDIFDSIDKTFTALLAISSSFFVVFFYFFKVEEKREKERMEEAKQQKANAHKNKSRDELYV